MASNGTLSKVNGGVLFAQDVNDTNNLFANNMLKVMLSSSGNMFTDYTSIQTRSILPFLSTASGAGSFAGGAGTGYLSNGVFNLDAEYLGTIDNHIGNSINPAIYTTGASAADGNSAMNIIGSNGVMGFIGSVKNNAGGMLGSIYTSGLQSVFTRYGQAIRVVLGSYSFEAGMDGGDATFRIGDVTLFSSGPATSFAGSGIYDIFFVGSNNFYYRKDFGSWSSGTSTVAPYLFFGLKIQEAGVTARTGSFLIMLEKYQSGTIVSNLTFSGTSFTLPTCYVNGSYPTQMLFTINGSYNSNIYGQASFNNGANFTQVPLGLWTTVSNAGSAIIFRMTQSGTYNPGSFAGGVFFSGLGAMFN